MLYNLANASKAVLITVVCRTNKLTWVFWRKCVRKFWSIHFAFRDREFQFHQLFYLMPNYSYYFLYIKCMHKMHWFSFPKISTNMYNVHTPYHGLSLSPALILGRSISFAFSLLWARSYACTVGKCIGWMNAVCSIFISACCSRPFQ